MLLFPQQTRMALGDRPTMGHPQPFENNTFTVMKAFTAAEIDAGASLIANVPGVNKARLVNVFIYVDVVVAGLVTLRLSDRAATPNDYVQWAVADLAANSKHNMESATTTITVGSLFNTALSATGYQLRAVGGTMTGGPIYVIAQFDLRG